MDRLRHLVAAAGRWRRRCWSAAAGGRWCAGTRRCAPSSEAGTSRRRRRRAVRRCDACTSVACPLAGDAFTSPSMATLAPVCRCLTTALVVRQFAGRDDLHVALAGAVVEFDEAEAALGVAAGADPALEADLLADGLGLAGVGDAQQFHDGVSLVACGLASTYCEFDRAGTGQQSLTCEARPGTLAFNCFRSFAESIRGSQSPVGARHWVAASGSASSSPRSSRGCSPGWKSPCSSSSTGR